MARKTFEASTEKLLHFVEVNFPINITLCPFLRNLYMTDTQINVMVFGG